MGILDSSSSASYFTDDRDQRVASGEDSRTAVANDASTLHYTVTDNGAVVGALESNQAVAESAFDLGADAIRDVLGYGEEVTLSGLDFASDALDSNDAALYESLGFGGDALGFGGDALEGALSYSGDVSENAFGVVSDVIGRLTGSFYDALDFAGDVVTASGEQIAQTTEKVANASRSDSAHTLDTFIKYGAGMMAVFFLVQALRKG